MEQPKCGPDTVLVKSRLTGVCRSDIDMMTGDFGPLPVSMQGHEGLGEVIEVGINITDVAIGDFVATRGEPAYADVYPVRTREYVKVPAVEAKYILEPVACGINIVLQAMRHIDHVVESNTGPTRVLILGSGFLAWIAYNTLVHSRQQAGFDITVAGRSNRAIWGDKLSSEYSGTFDIVIDLSDKLDVFDKSILNNQALVIFGAQKTVTTDFSNLLWKACTIVFPSPRTDNFYDCMYYALALVKDPAMMIDSFWTKEYDRDTEWQQAFSDGQYRPAGYSRGYIKWNNT